MSDENTLQNDKQASNLKPTPTASLPNSVATFKVDKQHSSDRLSFLVYPPEGGMPSVKIFGRLLPWWYFAPVGALFLIYLIYFVMSS